MLEVIAFIVKYRKVLIGAAIVALIAIFAFSIYSNFNLIEDNKRLKNNEIALTKDIETYKTKEGHNAAKVRQLELTVSEFKHLCADQEDELEELGIKIKRLESMTSTGTQTDVHGKTQLKDTVFVHKTDTVTIKENGKYFKWGDTWNTISGKIIGDNVECSYHGTDTLTVVAHRVPKKFLFIKWGTKYIEVDIVNKNSSTVITYNKTIKIKR